MSLLCGSVPRVPRRTASVSSHDLSSRWLGAALLSLLILVAGLAGPAAASAATLYVSTSGSDSAACTSAAPCKSFDRAYRQAAPGDVVQVAAGTYGGQSIPSLGRPAPDIEFKPAAGATVSMSSLSLNADNFIMRGMSVGGWLDVDTGNTSDFIDNLKLYDMSAKQHWMQGARNFLWKGGSIGPSFNDKASMIGDTPASSNITYDNVYWHDATRNDQNIHMECLWAGSVQGLTIRNSRFHNCAVMDVMVTQLNGPQPRDVVLENNIFETPRDLNGTGSAYYSFLVHANVTLNSAVIRNNVFESPINGDAKIQSGRFVGNIYAQGTTTDCPPGATKNYNVMTDGKCATSDKLVPAAFSQFANPGAGDWRLKSGARRDRRKQPDRLHADGRRGQRPRRHA